jgi:hypothetical protein
MRGTDSPVCCPVLGDLRGRGTYMNNGSKGRGGLLVVYEFVGVPKVPSLMSAYMARGGNGLG